MNETRFHCIKRQLVMSMPTGRISPLRSPKIYARQEVLNDALIRLYKRYPHHAGPKVMAALRTE